MEYLRQTIGSDKLSDVFKLPASLQNKKVEVIILPFNDEVSEAPLIKRRIGFMKGAELPDSFFDPLPDEELEAWGGLNENPTFI